MPVEAGHILGVCFCCAPLLYGLFGHVIYSNSLHTCHDNEMIVALIVVIAVLDMVSRVQSYDR